MSSGVSAATTAGITGSAYGDSAQRAHVQNTEHGTAVGGQTVVVVKPTEPSPASESTGCFACTIGKVQILAGLLISSVIAIAVTGLIMSHPGATTAIYSISSSIAFGAFVALIVAGMKRRNTNEAKLLWTTAEKVMKYSTVLILFCAVAITFTALVHHFPNASTAIYATGGVVSIITFVALTMLGIKRMSGDDDDGGTDPLNTKGATPPGKGSGAAPGAASGVPSGAASERVSPPGGAATKPPQAKPSASLPPPARLQHRGTGSAYDGSNPFDGEK